jgi:hypothetical protein
MEYREVTFVPGLYKIFDEIVVNAADNKQNDKNMDEMKITMDRESGEISVWNNGRGIPIEIHPVRPDPPHLLSVGVWRLTTTLERKNLRAGIDFWSSADILQLR